MPTPETTASAKPLKKSWGRVGGLNKNKEEPQQPTPPPDKAKGSPDGRVDHGGDTAMSSTSSTGPVSKGEGGSKDDKSVFSSGTSKLSKRAGPRTEAQRAQMDKRRRMSCAQPLDISEDETRARLKKIVACHVVQSTRVAFNSKRREPTSVHFMMKERDKEDGSLEMRLVDHTKSEDVALSDDYGRDEDGNSWGDPNWKEESWRKIHRIVHTDSREWDRVDLSVRQAWKIIDVAPYVGPSGVADVNKACVIVDQTDEKNENLIFTGHAFIELCSSTNQDGALFKKEKDNAVDRIKEAYGKKGKAVAWADESATTGGGGGSVFGEPYRGEPISFSQPPAEGLFVGVGRGGGGGRGEEAWGVTGGARGGERESKPVKVFSVGPLSSGSDEKNKRKKRKRKASDPVEMDVEMGDVETVVEEPRKPGKNGKNGKAAVGANTKDKQKWEVTVPTPSKGKREKGKGKREKKLR